MPRGGSKKGERRGGRRTGEQPRPPTLASLLKSANPEPKKEIAALVINPKGKAKSAKGTGKPGRPKGTTGPHLTTMEREREINMLIAGTSFDLLPRDVMLKTMRYFLEQAEIYRLDVMRWGEISPPTNETMTQVAFAEAKFERYLVLAGDMAYKVAPYMHARLTAIKQVSGSDRSPTTVIAELLVEIDQLSRGRLITLEPEDVTDTTQQGLIPQQEDA